MFEFLGSLVWSQKLDLVIPVGPFHLRIFRFSDYLILYFLGIHRKINSTENHGKVQETEQGIDFHPLVKKHKLPGQKRTEAPILCFVLSVEVTGNLCGNSEDHTVSSVKGGSIN